MTYYTFLACVGGILQANQTYRFQRTADMIFGPSTPERHNYKIRNIPTSFSILCCLGISLLALSSMAQAAEVSSPIVREYVEVQEQANYADLLAKFGRNKELSEGFELQTLLALSHYPALSESKIRFIVDDVSIPLSSRPHWASMLHSAKNRTYLVVIDSTLSGSRDALLLKNQPFNAQVGIIGHELAHTVYYLNRSFFGIIGDAICQLSRCRLNFERSTDQRLIDYGLGWQRYDHALFVRRRLSGSEETVVNLEGGGGAYMSPLELRALIEAHPAYAD